MTPGSQNRHSSSSDSRRGFLKKIGLVGMGAALPALASGRASAQDQGERQYTGTARIAIQDILCQTDTVQTYQYPATLQLARLQGDPNPLSLALTPASPAQFNTPGALFVATYGPGGGFNIRFWELQRVETEDPSVSGFVGQVVEVYEGGGSTNSLVLERSIIPCRPGPGITNLYPMGVGTGLALVFNEREAIIRVQGITLDQANQFQYELRASRSR